MTSEYYLRDQRAFSLSHKVFAAEQVRRWEPEAAKRCGFSMYALMEAAGAAAYALLRRHWPEARRILVVCGTGNNGGDGYVLARLAHADNLYVQLVSVDPKKSLLGDALTAQLAWTEAGGVVCASEQADWHQQDVIIDGLLGTGISGAPKTEYRSLIACINASDAPVLSLDIPSGIDADTGWVLSEGVEASMTVTFVAIKSGLVTGAGKGYCGRLFVDELGIGEVFAELATPTATYLGHENLQPLQKRPQNSHKGMFGRLLCIGGNQGMPGAIRMAAEAALRSGAGLVKVYCHPQSQLSISVGRPELMVVTDDIDAHLQWASCLLLGPGLGQDVWAAQLCEQVLASAVKRQLPLLVDADGLNWLSKQRVLERPVHWVLTPHPGEAARLLNTGNNEIEQHRYEAAKKLANQYQSHIVLKGAGSIQCSQDALYVCSNGNPGMASGGMGDVLAGTIAGLMAQGMGAQSAAIYGTCIHSRAGDLAAEKNGQRGILASDLFDHIHRLVNIT